MEADAFGRESFARYLVAVADYVDLIEQVDPASLDGPGLGVWDLRALIGHTSRSLVTVIEYAARPADQIAAATAVDYYRMIAETFTDAASVAERGRRAGEALGDDPATGVADLAEQARQVLDGLQPGYLLTTLVGGMPLEEYLRTRTFELVVHCLDIARATGLRFEASQETLADAVHLATEAVLGSGHGQAVLLALTGRDALPPGFSIV
ncbi:MAG: maleylpyruvate isomerase N-terminal domain-containing protein [Propionicimonas sp.]